MIVSHNTFTYLKPLGKFAWLLKHCARCQNNTIYIQKEKGVDCADIRIRLHKDIWWVCHGTLRYLPFVSALLLLHDCGIKNIRLLFEGKYTKEDIYKLEKSLTINYSEFNFFEGRKKSNWEQVIFYPMLDLKQHVGSMQSWYGKIVPYLYHIFHKRDFEKYLKELGNHSFDFV